MKICRFYWKGLYSESAEDLARQQRIKYGAVEGGSTAAFFRVSPRLLLRAPKLVLVTNLIFLIKAKLFC